MISFTLEVKEELIDIENTREESLAELSAFLRNSSNLSVDEVDFQTDNMLVAKRIYSLIKETFNVEAKNETEINKLFNRTHLYHVKVLEDKDLILKSLNIIDEDGKFLEQVNTYLVDDDISKRAYLRGLFLVCASINDPKKSRYHLDFLTDLKNEAVFIQRILNYFDLNSRITRREEKYMIYIKEAEKISDFLKLINAPKSVLYYENVRAYREQKNLTNRLNNMEQANQDKVIMTAYKQIEDIEYVETVVGLDVFDEKLKEAIDYRFKFPEHSLNELTKEMKKDNIKISKSGLNHRFRKINDYAEQLRKRMKRQG